MQRAPSASSQMRTATKSATSGGSLAPVRGRHASNGVGKHAVSGAARSGPGAASALDPQRRLRSGSDGRGGLRGFGSNLVHKPFRLTFASLAALVVLAAGSAGATYSLWSSSIPLFGNLTIEKGKLELNSYADATCSDQNDELVYFDNHMSADYVMIPGDTLTCTAYVQTIVYGTNLDAVLEMKTRANAKPLPSFIEAEFEISPVNLNQGRDQDCTAMAIVGGYEVCDGDDYEITLEISWPDDGIGGGFADSTSAFSGPSYSNWNDEQTPSETISLDDFEVVLTQVRGNAALN